MRLSFTKLFSIYKQSAVIYVLVAAFLLLASFYSVVVPPYEAPDEIGHFAYVLQLRQTKQLPVQQVGVPGAAQHPPLYYLIAAILSLPGDTTDNTGAYRPNPEFMWRANGGDDVNISQHHTEETFPYKGQALILHLARLASVFMGAFTVILVFLIGKRIFPANLEIGGLAATLVAFNPQFLFISGVINNDNLLTLAATGLCFHLFCAISSEKSTKYWFYIGLWLSVATLAKVNGLLFILIVGVFLVLHAFQRRSLTFLIKNGLVIGIPILIASSWWFIRNWMLYGDLLGWSVYIDIFSANLRQSPLSLNELRNFFATQFNTFWGRFGWSNIWAPAWFYNWIRLLLTIASTGIFVLFVRKWRALFHFQHTAIVALVFIALTYEGYMLWAITQFNNSWYQGRYIFPIIAPLMILMSIGILSWIAERFRAIVCLFLLLAMCVMALFMPLYVIRPAYRTVAQPKWSTWLLPNKTAYQFGESILLRGYTVETAGSQLILNLYWQALQKPDFNYSAFVHLLDEKDTILAQNDHPPGE